MSRFETGGLNNRGRNAAALPGSPLATVSLAVPGLDVPPPVVQRSSLASSLLADFGLVDRISGTIADGVDRSLAFDRQKEAALDFAAERNRQAAEGAGINAASKLVPELSNALAQDTVVRSPEETRALVESMIRSRLDGMDPVSVDAAVNRYAPALIETGTRRVQELRDAATKEVVSNLLATAPSKSGEDVAKLAEQINATDPSISVEMARKTITAKRLDAAATAGDKQAFDAALAEAGVAIDENYVIKQRAELDNAIARQEAIAAADAVQRYTALSDVLPGEQVMELMRKDPSVKPTTIREFEERFKQADAVELNTLQDESYNALAVQVYKGQYDDKILDELDRRSDPARTPRTSPEYISAPQFSHLVDTIASQRKVDAEQPFANALVDDALNGRSTYAVGPEFDSSLTKAMAARGIVAGVQNGSVFKAVAITDPLQFARTTGSLGRVPATMTNVVQAGMESQDPVQFSQAAAAYAALHAVNPGLAESIPLSKSAQVKARYMTSRLATDPNVFASNAALTSAAAGEAKYAVGYNEALDVVENDTIVVKALGVSPKAQNLKATVEAKATKTLKDGIRANDIYGVKGGVVFGDTLAIPSEVTAQFQKHLPEEYRYWRSLPQLSEEQALEAATESAKNRTLNSHQPVSWNGVVRFGRNGEPGVNGRQLLAHMTDLVKQGQLTQEQVDDAWNRHVPVPVNVNGKVAWAFKQAGTDEDIWLTATPGASVRRGSRLLVTMDPTPMTDYRSDVLKALDKRKEKPAVTNMLIGPGVR